MANVPNYASTVNGALVQISTANANRDGTGTIGVVLTAAASGSRIDTIVVTAAGTTTAGMIRLYLSDGTNSRLWHEEPVLPVTPSATVPAWSVTVSSNNNLKMPVTLPSGYSLRASTNNAETFNVAASLAGNF